MAFDYEKSARSALALIEKFGASYEIQRSNDEYDPDTGETTDNAPFGGTLTAVKLPAPAGVSRNENFAEDVIKGIIGYFLAAASDAPFEPAAHDIIYVKAERWEVIGCTGLAPNGVDAIVYKIFAKKV